MSLSGFFNQEPTGNHTPQPSVETAYNFTEPHPSMRPTTGSGFRFYFAPDLLKGELKTYGLNPDEWNFQASVQSREEPLLFTHKNDHNFKLQAFYQWDHKPYLKDLQVISL